MMKEVRVRRATEQDLEAITNLWREMIDLHQEIEPAVWTTIPEANDHARRYFACCIGDADHAVFVAVAGSDLVGYLNAFKEKRPPMLTPPVVGGIGECCVTLAFRRRGAGRLLVAEAMNWFHAQGLALAEVGYAVGNPMAVSFWKGQGFRPYRAKALRPVERETKAAQPEVGKARSRRGGGVS